MSEIKNAIPDTFPFSTGLPMHSMYDYDCMERDNCDHAYMKQLCSSMTGAIQKEVEEACDKLEYAGSCMYHERPDPVRLSMITATIYENLQENITYSRKNIKTSSFSATSSCSRGQCHPRKPRCSHGVCPPPRPDLLPTGEVDWLKQFIDYMLYEEINHRRRRYRRRRPW